MFIYGVRDRKAARYSQIFTDYTDESATRSFIGVCQDTRTILGQYPTDFELYAIGELDETSGAITAMNKYLETGYKETKENGILFKNKETED